VSTEGHQSEDSGAEIRPRIESAEAPLQRGTRPKHNRRSLAGSATKSGRIERHSDGSVPLHRSTRAGTRWLIVILLVSTLVRLALAWGYTGFITGDDVEMLETGISPLNLLHYSPWDIRSLLIPRLLITPIAWLASCLGSSNPTLLVHLATLPFIGLATLNVAIVFIIARRTLSRRIGLLAAGIYAFHWLPLGYGATVYPRTVSTTCVLISFWLLLGDDRDLPRSLGAGVLVAFAFAARYSEVIFLAPLALMAWSLWLPSRRGLVRAVGLGGGFVLGASVFIGLVDLWTWGQPFHSLVEFARYTLVERGASSLQAHQPLYWYLRRAQFWLIPSLLPFLVVKRRGDRVLALWLMFSIPILVLSGIHHKEMRYLQGVTPFLAILVAEGVIWFWERGWRKTTMAFLLISAVLSLRTALNLHQEKSLSAVRAALELRDDPEVDAVLLTQAWAHGDHLFLGPQTRLTNFDVAPSPEELEAGIAKVDAAAFYEDDLKVRPALRRVLRGAGFEETLSFEVGESRPVVVFRRF